MQENFVAFLKEISLQVYFNINKIVITIGGKVYLYEIPEKGGYCVQKSVTLLELVN